MNNFYNKPDIDPVITEIKINSSSRYCDSNALVSMEVTNRDGERELLKVKYPIQERKHLVSLMTNVETDESFPHADMMIMRGAILGVLDE